MSLVFNIEVFQIIFFENKVPQKKKKKKIGAYTLVFNGYIQSGADCGVGNFNIAYLF